MQISHRTKIEAIAVLLIVGITGTGYARWVHSGKSFTDLFLTRDQQGRYYFDKGQCAQAAQRFEDPMWKGLALYAAEDFEAAIGQFASIPTAEAMFSLGNAYAHSKQYVRAVESYDRAIKLKPQYEEARFNRQWVQKIIEEYGQASTDDKEDPGGYGTQVDDDITRQDLADKDLADPSEPMGDDMSEDVMEMWMRRVQTSPADFLRSKFAFQLQDSNEGD